MERIRVIVTCYQSKQKIEKSIFHIEILSRKINIERIRVIVTCYRSKQKIEKSISRTKIICKNQYGESQSGA